MACGLGLLCCVLYAWTLDFPFVFDDYFYMTENPLFLEAKDFPQLTQFREFAQSPARRNLDPDFATNLILRPVAYASLHLNHALDGFNPRWYRALNVVIHGFNAWLVFYLLRLLTRRCGLGADSVFWLSAGTALVFVAHPLATESVTYVIQRFTSLSMMFYLLVLCLYLKVADTEKLWPRRLLMTTAVLFLALGMLTKEDVFTAPFVAVLLEVGLLGRGLKAAVWRARGLLMLTPLIPGLVWLTSWAQNGGDWSLEKALNIVNLRNQPWSHEDYLMTQATVVVDYMRQIFWPTDLNLLPEWPAYHSWLEQPVVLSVTLIAVLLLGFTWLKFRRGSSIHSSLCWVSLLWFFMTVSISSSLIPLPDLKADHRTYLPSMGLLVFALALVDWLRLRFIPADHWRRIMPVALSLIVLMLTVLTVQRNEVWRTNVSLWQDTVKKSPGQFSAWMNLGAAYAESQEHDKAIDCAKRALAIRPRLVVARLNMVHSLVIQERWRECLDVSLPLIESCPVVRQNYHFMFNVGLAQAGVGHFYSALEIFEALLPNRPNDHRLHKVVGMVHANLRHPRRALAHLQRSKELHGGDPHLLRLIEELQRFQNQSVLLTSDVDSGGE